MEKLGTMSDKAYPSASSEAKLEASDVAEGSLAEGDLIAHLGYTAELPRNRSMFNILLQTLAIASIPYGEGGPFISAIAGGGQLAIFVGWIVVCVLDQCKAMSLAELASRYPTSAGPYYWSFQMAGEKSKTLISFINGWMWIIGNWTNALALNFGFASMVSATVAMFKPGWVASDWQLLLIFWALCIVTSTICYFGNRYLPQVEQFCAVWTVVGILAILISLAVKASYGRHDVSFALTNYDTTISGYGKASFIIGMLPPAYVWCAVGMISGMAEEVSDPAIKVPQAMVYSIPVGFIAGLFLILPICFTLPPVDMVAGAPQGQAFPYIFHLVMGTPGGGLGLTLVILGCTLFASIGVTTAVSRITWAFARDKAIPFSHIWDKIDHRQDVPRNALLLSTAIEMLLGFINLGSSSAFSAFMGSSVVALAISYAMPIAVSLFSGRREVNQARWTCGPIVGTILNVVSLAWLAFQTVLFSMPNFIPVTAVSMNYGSVVLVGFCVLSAIWYIVHARKVYKGPPLSDGIGRL